MTKTFIVPFHVKPMEHSIMPPELTGAYVSCYATGNNYVEATQKSLKKLSEDGLYPQEILQPIYEINSKDWTKHINEIWADQSASLLTQTEFEDALRNDNVVYGPFGSYT